MSSSDRDTESMRSQSPERKPESGKKAEPMTSESINTLHEDPGSKEIDIRAQSPAAPASTANVLNPFIPAGIDSLRPEANFLRPDYLRVNPAYPHHSALPPPREVDSERPVPETALVPVNASAEELCDLHFIHRYSFEQILWFMKRPTYRPENYKRDIKRTMRQLMREAANSEWAVHLQIYINILDPHRAPTDPNMKRLRPGQSYDPLTFPPFFPKPEVLKGKKVFGLYQYGFIPIPSYSQEQMQRYFRISTESGLQNDGDENKTSTEEQVSEGVVLDVGSTGKESPAVTINPSNPQSPSQQEQSELASDKDESNEPSHSESVNKKRKLGSD